MLPEPEYADIQMVTAKLILLSDGKMFEIEGASWKVKKGVNKNSKKDIHTEIQYIEKALDGILELATNRSCAIILTSTSSPCYHQQQCVHNIVEMIRTNDVPHIVIYYYPFKNELETVDELSENNIAVFQVIGDHLYFVNRMEIFNQNSHVEFDEFLKWLENSLTTKHDKSTLRLHKWAGDTRKKGEK